MPLPDIFARIRGGLIVSCQALPQEPLYGSAIMAKMALAAYQAGAKGIRANTVADIAAIRQEVPLPVIGLIKKTYPGSDVFITPTGEEVAALISAGVDIIAMDATGRTRPGGQSLADTLREAKALHPGQVFMADCSNFEEAQAAEAIGFDCVGTTLAGYTPYTMERALPDIALVHALVKALRIPVIAEGGIHTPAQLREAMDAGAWCAVVGGAITRPLEIARRFIEAL